MIINKIVNIFFLSSVIIKSLILPSVYSVDMNDCTIVNNNNINNKTYLFCNDKERWNDANTFCKENNGNLLTISSIAESDWIYNKRQTINNMNSDVWIGLKTTNRFSWYWKSGDNGYINWKPGTPNGFRIINCARLRPTSKYLDDSKCSYKFNFI